MPFICCIKNFYIIYLNYLLTGTLALEILKTASSSPTDFSWTTPQCAALAKLGVHDMPADFGSAVAGIAGGGMNKSLNLSGLVTGAFLQVWTLNIAIPLIRGTGLAPEQYPGAGS